MSTLHARLLWAALLPLGLLLGAGALWLQSAFVAAVERGFDQRLAATLEALVASVEPAADGSLTLRRSLAESGYAQVRSGWYWQVGDAAGVLKRSRSLWDAELPAPAAIGAAPGFVDLAGPAGEPLRAVAREIRFAARASPLRFVVAAPRAAIDTEIATFGRLLLAGIGGVLALSALALWLQVRLGLRPLRRLQAQLGEIESGARGELSAPAVRELAALAHKINSVLAHNQRMALRGRKLAGDLAHALKTPLAVLRSEPAVAASVSAQQAIGRLDAIVQRHLAQASAQARRQHARTDLASLASALRGMFLQLHQPRALALEIDVPAGSTVACEEDDLGEMLGNLIDNACRAAQSRVRLQARAAGAQLRIEIDDDGAGLDAAALARLGVRGERLDQQSGAGLGVSISRDIAESHGGALEFARSELGGVCARLWLPAAAPR